MSSVTIERIETRLVDLPTIRPHKLSVATMHGQTLMLVKVCCSDGVTVGEGTTIAGMAYGPESPEAMKLAIDTYLAPAIIGKDATRIQTLMAFLGKLAKVNHFAKSALETALLDAHGKRLGVPVSELLGGRRRDRLPVAWTLASGNTATDIAEAERMLDQRRHNVFKLKIGAKSPETDIRHVAEIKRAVGDRAAVRVDVNMAWSETQAARAIPALADAGCELVEQPVASAAALARLMRRFPVALMADEILQARQRIRDREAPRRRRVRDQDRAKRWPVRRAASPRSRMRPASSCTAARCSKARSARWRPRTCSRVSRTYSGHRAVRAAVDHRRDRDAAARLQRLRTDRAGRPGLGIELDEDKVRRFTRDGLTKVAR